MNAEWILNKAKEKIYAITHAKAVIRGDSTVDNDLSLVENNITDLQTQVSECFQSVSDGKTLVANAITDKGVSTSIDATFATMAENIEIIQTGIDTDVATASPEDILWGETAGVKGEIITGTMANLAGGSVVGNANTGTLESGDTAIANSSAHIASMEVSTDSRCRLGSQMQTSGYVDASSVFYQWISNLTPSNVKVGVSVGKHGGDETNTIVGTFTSDGNVTPSQMLLDSVGYANGVKVIGTIPKKDATTYTPTTTNQTIATGQYLSGVQTIKGDSNLVTGNIKAGVSIFGVSGKASVVDTSDATGGASHLLSGYTAYNNGSKITGGIPNRGFYSSQASSYTLYSNRLYMRIPYGYYDGGSGGDAECYLPDSIVASLYGITADKIVSGYTVCGIVGTGIGQGKWA